MAGAYLGFIWMASAAHTRGHFHYDMMAAVYHGFLWILSAGEHTHNKHFNVDVMHSLSWVSASCIGHHPAIYTKEYFNNNMMATVYHNQCIYRWRNTVPSPKGWVGWKIPHLLHKLTLSLWNTCIATVYHQHPDIHPQAGIYIQSHMYTDTQKHEHKALYWHTERACCHRGLLAPHYSQFNRHDGWNTAVCVSPPYANIASVPFQKAHPDPANEQQHLSQTF